MPRSKPSPDTATPPTALAAQPEAATTIITGVDGLIAGHATVPVSGGSLPLYAARPAGAAKPPIVLLIHEVFGVHAHIADVARRLAYAGHLAVAPELFFRAGDPGTAPSIEALREGFVAPTPDAQVLADLDVAAAWAVASGGDQERISVVGFCWGGRIAWLYAAHRRDLRAAVAWYGRLSGPLTANQPRHPLDVAGDLRAPVLGLYGGADQGIPVEQVSAFQDALAAAGRGSRIDVFPGAPHAFHADYRPSYRPDAASDGWRRQLAWLRTHGAGP